MKEYFVTAHRFSDPEEAILASATLKEHNIQHYIQEEKLAFDPTFAYTTTPFSIHLKVKQHDLQNALDLLHLAADDHTDVTIGSFMNELTDEELKEVIYKRDEWSDEEAEQAEQLLKQRGITYSNEQKRSMRQQRIEEIRTPRAASKGWLIFGFVIALMGGLFGIAMGASYYFLKGRDPEGKRYFIYNKSTRLAGLLMMITGMAVTICVIGIAYDRVWGMKHL